MRWSLLHAVFVLVLVFGLLQAGCGGEKGKKDIGTPDADVVIPPDVPRMPLQLMFLRLKLQKPKIRYHKALPLYF